MLGGIAFQLLVMIIYVAYGGWWGYRARKEIARSGTDMQYMLYALAAASACIIARGIFRTIELEEGFSGYLAVCSCPCSFFLSLRSSGTDTQPLS